MKRKPDDVAARILAGADLAGTRDASWYRTPGTATAVHALVVHDGAHAVLACNPTGRVLLDGGSVHALAGVKRTSICRRRACLKRWEEAQERAASNRRVGDAVASKR